LGKNGKNGKNIVDSSENVNKKKLPKIWDKKFENKC